VTFELSGGAALERRARAAHRKGACMWTGWSAISTPG